MTQRDPAVEAARAAARQERIERLLRNAERVYSRALASGETRLAAIFYHAVTQALERNNPWYLGTIERMVRVPVTIEEFLSSRDFFGAVDDESSIWPQVRRDIIRLNPDIIAGAQPIIEYTDGGATGTGKTFKAQITQIYQLYQLLCMRKPHRLFRLLETTPIIFALFSLRDETTRNELYRPMRQMIEAMPFFQRYTRWNKDKTSVMDFEGNIDVRPLTATVEAMVGKAIISAHLDEVCFMAVVERSRQTTVEGGQGGLYDQAQIAYDTVTRRRRSRFTSPGPVPGLVGLSSSILHTEDFLNRRRRAIEEQGRRDAVVLWHRQYDVQPADRYTEPRFRLLVGTREYRTRILGEDDREGVDYPAGARVEMVPGEYRTAFLDNPEGALRDVVGEASSVIQPFLAQRDRISDAITAGIDAGLRQWVVRDELDLARDGMPIIDPEALPRDRNRPRFVHVDLSRSQDRCGIAVSSVVGYEQRDTGGDTYEVVPIIDVELALSIRPSRAMELDVAEVRRWVMALTTRHRIPLARVTYDGFDSRETLQLIRQAGISAGVLSMDVNSEPYETLRRTIYEGRLRMVNSELARIELANLEYDASTGKVDHPMRGSKDVADAICGAVYSATRSREVRGNITVVQQDGTAVIQTTTRGTTQRVRSMRG